MQLDMRLRVLLSLVHPIWNVELQLTPQKMVGAQTFLFDMNLGHRGSPLVRVPSRAQHHPAQYNCFYITFNFQLERWTFLPVKEGGTTLSSPLRT